MTPSPSNSPSARANLPRIVHAQNDILTDDSGHTLIDLFSGNGAALFGHAHPAIAHAVKRQLDSVWLTGGLSTPIHDQAQSALEKLLPPTHALARFYSTGMEAAEFAIRFARTVTGKPGVIGFAGAMHGKSAATAPLGWSNAHPLPEIHRLPFPTPESESAVLAQLASTLAPKNIAAVFLEPILGSSGCHIASDRFCSQLVALCQSHGALSVFDEILTGFHRTGPRFFSAALPSPPDILLLGKALANGFPASAVTARRDLPVTPAMLPGSTFAGNPLAAAAIAATLDEHAKHDLPALIAAISRAISENLAAIRGTTLRGQGALWMLELQPPLVAEKIAETLYRRGVFISFTAHYLRILPAATITPAHLQQACRLVRDALSEPSHA